MNFILRRFDKLKEKLLSCIYFYEIDHLNKIYYILSRKCDEKKLLSLDPKKNSRIFLRNENTLVFLEKTYRYFHRVPRICVSSNPEHTHKALHC